MRGVGSGAGLLAATRRILGELDVEVVYERILEAAQTLTGARYAALGLMAQEHDSVPGPLSRWITSGIDPDEVRGMDSPPRGMGLLAEPINNPVPLRVADLTRHPRSYGFPVGHPPMHAFIGTPVFVDSAQYANLYVTEKDDGGEFDADDEGDIVALAELAGTAISNALRYTATSRRSEELEQAVAALEATTQVTRAIGDETDLRVVLELIAKRGRALVSARVLLIELLRGEELLVAASAGEAAPELIGQMMPLSGTFAEHATRIRSSIRIDDELARARFDEVGVGRLGVRAAAGLVVPLLFHDRAFGVLVAIDRLRDGPEFTVEDARLLEAFAASAATAVALASTVATDIDRLAAVVRSSSDAIITTDEDGLITSWNAGAEQLYGYTADETIGRHGGEISRMIVPPEAIEEMEVQPTVMAGESVGYRETRRVHKDGSRLDVSLKVAAIRDHYGNIVGLASIARDITEQKQTQRILAQTERLESIGQLVGGVAHDMNNMLTSILAHAEFAIGELPADHLARRDVVSAQAAAKRAAKLVRQLLLFARQADLATETLDLSNVAGGLIEMLARTLGEQIVVRAPLSGEVWPITADRSQVEQVIINLAINARDAMQDGGDLTISTGNVELRDEQVAGQTGAALAGPYVRLAVRDTGVGMTPEVVAKAFDPFFTTKPVGSGTGLGLASVYGILAKAGGHLRVVSTPGEGTTMEAYWPVATEEAQRAAAVADGLSAAEPAQPAGAAAGRGAARSESRPEAGGVGHGETILVVEDEPALRKLTTRILESHDYRVLTAGRPSEARVVLEEHSGRVDLLITDVMLPESRGTELAVELCAVRRDLAVLYVSGYVPDAADLPPGAAFLGKPFTPQQLLNSVDRALTQRGAAAA